MDYLKLKRGNKADSAKFLKRTGDVISCTSPIEVCIPKEYERKGLYSRPSESHISIAGLLTVIYEGKYYPMTILSLFNSEPLATKSITIGDKEYYIFTYEKGSKFMQSRTLIKAPALIDGVLSLFLFRAYIPWYFSVEDVSAIMSTIGKYTGLHIDKVKSINELLVGRIARHKDTLELARYSGGLPHKDTVFKGIANSGFATDSPFRLWLGGYESRAYTVMVTKDPAEVTVVEEALRK